MTKSIKNIRKQFHDQGIFYTPPELAEKVKSLVDLTQPRDVYDPTCGAGGLLKVFPDSVPKFGQEKDPEGYELAKSSVVNGTFELGDTLVNPAFSDRKFHCIVGNPPFSVKWNPGAVTADDERFSGAPCLPPPSKADYAFILHILHYLADDGIAVVLEFPGILYRGQREGKIRQWLVEQNVIDYIEEIPGNTFEDTSVATVMLVFRKNRNTEAPIRMKTEHGEFEVGLDDIKNNGYQLTPSSFDPYEEPKEQIDPIALRDQARAEVKNYLINQIKFEIAVCELEKWDYKAFLEELINLIKEYI